MQTRQHIGFRTVTITWVHCVKQLKLVLVAKFKQTWNGTPQIVTFSHHIHFWLLKNLKLYQNIFLQKTRDFTHFIVSNWAWFNSRFHGMKTDVEVLVEGSYVMPQHSSEECNKRCTLAVSLLLMLRGNLCWILSWRLITEKHIQCVICQLLLKESLWFNN